MQTVTVQQHPAIHAALTMLHVDNVPWPVPETFSLRPDWELDRIEPALAALGRAPVGAGEEDLLSTELWQFVCPNDETDGVDPTLHHLMSDERVKLAHPQAEQALSYAQEMLNSCFEGEDCDTWFDQGPMLAAAQSMRERMGGG